MSSATILDSAEHTVPNPLREHIASVCSLIILHVPPLGPVPGGDQKRVEGQPRTDKGGRENKTTPQRTSSASRQGQKLVFRQLSPSPEAAGTRG